MCDLVLGVDKFLSFIFHFVMYGWPSEVDSSDTEIWGVFAQFGLPMPRTLLELNLNHS